MAVPVQCPSCGAVHAVFEATVGRRVRCPQCHKLVEARAYVTPGAGHRSLAHQVLDMAEQQGLLEPKAIIELRKQLAETKFIVTPEAIAKVLVDHGHLTPFQARKLVGQALASGPEIPARQLGVKRLDTPTRPATPEEFALADEEQITPGGSEEIVELEAVPPSSAVDYVDIPVDGGSPRKGRQPLAETVDDEYVELEPIYEPPPLPSRRKSAWRTDDAEVPVPQSLEGLTPLDGLVPLDEPQPFDPLDDAATAASAAGPVGGRPAAVFRLPKNVWDSPLLLVGGGLFGVLLIAFGLLFYALTRGTASELFQSAEEAYRGGDYGGAMAGFDTFLRKYPDNPEASLARVRRGMAELRQVSDSGKNPGLALETATQVLKRIETEEQFHQARSELATILPQIADAFATQAGEAEEMARREELVERTGQALALVNNPAYVPASLRQERAAQITGVLDKLQVAERRIDQDKKLAEALTQIESAAEKGHVAAAYQTRDDLLRMYPQLQTSAELLSAIRQVGERERQLVEVSQPATAALTEEPAGAAETIILAADSGAAASATPQPVFVLVDGAVYGLDGASGRVLWRRYVGYESTSPPLSVGGPAADAILIDAAAREAVRVNGTSGKLVWRQPLGAAAAGIVLAKDQAIVTTRTGRILQLDAASGQLVRAAQLPQPATLPAAYDSRQGRLLALGEHSTLFVLEAPTLVCTETVYLGHKPGSIFVPPAAVLDHVLIAECPGDDYSLLRVFSPDAKTKRLTPVGKPLRLKGRIVTPLAVSRGRVAAVTDLGQIDVYEADAASPQAALRQIGGERASESAPHAAFALLDGNRLWTASRRRSLLELQPATQQLSRQWTHDHGDTFLAPLTLQGGTLIHARRRAGSPAVTVEGSDAASGQTLWMANLAEPVVAVRPDAGRSTVDVLTATGRLYAVKAGEFAAGAVLRPAFAPPAGSAPAILSEAATHSSGNVLVWTESGPGGRVFIYNSATGAAPTSTALPSQAGAAAPAQLFGKNLLTPLTDGSVALQEPGSGKSAAQAFQPPLAPGELPQWMRPAISTSGDSLLIYDGRGTVYAVALVSQPQAHLLAKAEVPAAEPIVSPLVPAGLIAVCIARSPSGDLLAGFTSSGTPAFEPQPLAGRVRAGPFFVGEAVLIDIEPSGLVCFDAAGKQHWQENRSGVDHGPLAGPPVSVGGGDSIVLHQAGVVRRIAAADGKELAMVDLGQPLGPAACVIGQHLVVAGAGGVLHRLPLPPRP